MVDAMQSDRSIDYLPISFQPPLTPSPKDLFSKFLSQKTESYEVIQTEDNVLALETDGNDCESVESSITSSIVFVDKFFLTAVRSEKEYPQAGINPESQKHLEFGRPNLPEIFAEVEKMCNEEHFLNVGVFVCGPKSMTDEVNDLCRQSYMKCNRVKFDCHVETFDF